MHRVFRKCSCMNIFKHPLYGLVGRSANAASMHKLASYFRLGESHRVTHAPPGRPLLRAGCMAGHLDIPDTDKLMVEAIMSIRLMTQTWSRTEESPGVVTQNELPVRQSTLDCPSARGHGQRRVKLSPLASSPSTCRPWN
jgi:hypothetical protein